MDLAKEHSPSLNINLGTEKETNEVFKFVKFRLIMKDYGLEKYQNFKYVLRCDEFLSPF